MSDLATAARLRQAASQFPVAWYCDPRVLDAERRHLLARAPGYVGHTLMAPDPGDYHVLAARSNAQALVHGPQGIELLSNICRHRQAIMLNVNGNTQSIVCPIHRWTYDLQGKLLTTFGKVQSITEVRERIEAPYRIIDVIAVCDHSPLAFRVAFDAANRIAAVHISPNVSQ